jgi:hypothetical protein
MFSSRRVTLDTMTFCADSAMIVKILISQAACQQTLGNRLLEYGLWGKYWSTDKFGGRSPQWLWWMQFKQVDACSGRNLGCMQSGLGVVRRRVFQVFHLPSLG